MNDDQISDLHLLAGLMVGFFLGFWRGLLQLQQQIDERLTADLDRVSSVLTGMQPLGQACIFALLGACLFTLLYQNNLENSVASAGSR